MIREGLMPKIDEFCAHLKERHVARISRDFPEAADVLDADFYADPGGRKYIRIVREDTNGSHKSVHCFIEIVTGNILKAAGWKSPAKHARGNIFESFERGMGDHGARYLR